MQYILLQVQGVPFVRPLLPIMLLPVTTQTFVTFPPVSYFPTTPDPATPSNGNPNSPSPITDAPTSTIFHLLSCKLQPMFLPLPILLLMPLLFSLPLEEMPVKVTGFCKTRSQTCKKTIFLHDQGLSLNKLP